MSHILPSVIALVVSNLVLLLIFGLRIKHIDDKYKKSVSDTMRQQRQKDLEQLQKALKKQKQEAPHEK